MSIQYIQQNTYKYSVQNINKLQINKHVVGLWSKYTLHINA